MKTLNCIKEKLKRFISNRIVVITYRKIINFIVLALLHLIFSIALFWINLGFIWYVNDYDIFMYFENTYHLASFIFSYIIAYIIMLIFDLFLVILKKQICIGDVVKVIKTNYEWKVIYIEDESFLYFFTKRKYYLNNGDIVIGSEIKLMRHEKI